MSSNFIYLTKKKALGVFLGLQLAPFLMISTKVSLIKQISLWALFEIVILGVIFLWQLKPIEEFDEREKSIVLKWKGRIIDHGMSVLLIPLVVICFKPGIEAWDLYIVSAVPSYIVFTLYHVLMKRELGYYFYERSN